MEHHGWAVVPGFLAVEESRLLHDECEAARLEGRFKPAGVGRGHASEVREDIRRDQILWLESGSNQLAYLARLEVLRLELNQRFFLGLLDFEGHFAVYPEGAFYKAHLDRHAGTSNRIITVILYLNEFWQPGDGGELVLRTEAGMKDGPFERIEPRMGTLVCFFSADHWHEVLPAIKSRASITGWFRARS